MENGCAVIPIATASSRGEVWSNERDNTSQVIVTENIFVIGGTSGKYCKPIVKLTEYTLTSATLVVLSDRVSPAIARKGCAGFNVYTLGPQ